MPAQPQPGSPVRDVALHLRQLLRDLGPTPRAARQVAKVLWHGARGVLRPGAQVEGIRRPRQVDRSLAVPLGFVTAAAAPPSFTVAAVCHVFHPDLAAELRGVLANVPGRLDIHASTDTEAKRAELLGAFAGWPKGEVAVRLVPNRGRDIGPKLTAFGDVHDRYDLVLHLHTKRNSNLVSGTGWREYLLHNLAGSAAIAGSILELFRRDPRLGIVAAQHWEPIRPWVDWSQDFRNARALARRMGLSLTPAHAVDFPSGSMFWARPAALRPMLGLGLRPEDFPDEGGQLEGTPAHALERLFFFSCERAGLHWLKVCDPTTAAHPETVIQARTPDELAAYLRRHRFQLTAST